MSEKTTGSSPTRDIDSRIEIEHAPTPGAPLEIHHPMQQATWNWFLALMALSLLVASFALTGGAAFEPVDAWVAQTAREMDERTRELGWEGFIVPWFAGEVRLQKSPGPYWAVMGVSWMLGKPVDEFSVRLPSAIACVLMTLTVFWLTRRIAGDRAAIFAGFATSSCAVVLFWTGRGSADMTVATLMAMSLACLWVASEDEPPGLKRGLLWLAGWFLAGLAMLYKMPLPLACVGLPAVLYVLICNRWKIFLSWWHVAGLLLFLASWLPWAIAISQYESQATAKWWVEFVDRMTGELPNVEEQQESVLWYFFYIVLAFAFVFPYSLSIPAAVARAFRPAEGVRRRGQIFLLVWFFGLLAFFTYAAGKETRYFLPALPALMCLLGIELAAFFDPRRKPRQGMERIGFVAVVVLIPVAFAGLIVYFYRRVYGRGVYENIADWGELYPPLIVAAGLFTLGAILSALYYLRRREHFAFAVLTATMWIAWIWTWKAVLPLITSAAQFKEIAADLNKLTPEQHAMLRQVAHHDPRIIWYGDLRYPRLVSVTELLEIQQGDRDIQFELRYWGERITEALEDEQPVLLVAGPRDYATYMGIASIELAKVDRELPETYIWFTATRGHPSTRYLVFGNRPPPWPQPQLHEKIAEWISAVRERYLAGDDLSLSSAGRVAARLVSQ